MSKTKQAIMKINKDISQFTNTFGSLFDPDTSWIPEAIRYKPDDSDEMREFITEQQVQYVANTYYTTLFFSLNVSDSLSMLEDNYIAYIRAMEENIKAGGHLGEPIDFLDFIDKTLEIYPQYEPFKSNESWLNDPNISVRKKRVHEWIEKKIEKLNTEEPIRGEGNEFNTRQTVLINDRIKHKPEKSFLEFLIMDEDKKRPFADKLKKNFPGIKGKDFAVMLRALEAEKYICIIDRQRSALYKSLKIFYNWDICSNSAINRAINQYSLYKTELDFYQKKIQDIYKSIK